MYRERETERECYGFSSAYTHLTEILQITQHHNCPLLQDFKIGIVAGDKADYNYPVRIFLSHCYMGKYNITLSMGTC